MACTSGRTSMPGVRMSTMKKVMPLCLGASGSVRAMRMPKSAWWASEVHTFWPFTTHSSPSRTARVPRAARSLPAPGSLNSWHHTSSPRSSGPRYRCCCSGEPWRISGGPTSCWEAPMNPVVTSKARASWLKMMLSLGVPPRPPNALGQAMPGPAVVVQGGLPLLGATEVVGLHLGVGGHRAPRPVGVGAGLALGMGLEEGQRLGPEGLLLGALVEIHVSDSLASPG